MSSKPQPGEHWGYRIKTDLAEPLQEVEVLQYGPKVAGQKVRIRYIGGEYPGLDEWVPPRRLVTPWEEVPAFMADEQRMRAARDDSGLDVDEPTMSAIQFVLDALQLGQLLDLGFQTRTWGLLTIPDVPALEAKLPVTMADLLADPLVFTDRSGRLVAPVTVALALAKRLCAEATGEVMAAVIGEEEEERRQAVTGRYYGKDYVSPEIVQQVMREHSEPIWRLVRSWCDSDTVARFDELATLRAEVARLREIILEQVKFLRQDRHPHLAKALEARLNEVTLVDQ